MPPYQRSWLKWPGAKFRILNRLLAVLPVRNRFFDVFMGGGSVTLNSAAAPCFANDANFDLIAVWRCLQDGGREFIGQCEHLFSPETDDEATYYAMREEFNHGGEPQRHATLFVYLNRHCFNGLCRYNRDGAFNASFAHNTPKRFPGREMQDCLPRLAQCIFSTDDFREVMAGLGDGDVAYCDPPYIPLSNTSDFNRYHPGHFSLADHMALAEAARNAAQRGAYVVVSNHLTEEIRDLYQATIVETVEVHRSISCKADGRASTQEAFFIFSQRERPVITFDHEYVSEHHKLA